MRLDGAVALVTGASGGIGGAITARLAKAGARVGIHYRTSAGPAEELARQITAAGGEAMTVACDVSQEDQVESMFKGILERWGKMDILVNNAGITRDALLLRMSADAWDDVIDINLRGAYLCSKHAMPHMVRARSGRIINMSSVVGLLGNPGQANYAASKAGLIGFTKAVAREVASRNITVNAIAPGYIITSMVDRLSEETKGNILARIPMARFGSAEDVAALVTFLCSEEAGYITGQVFGIDGGLAM